MKVAILGNFTAPWCSEVHWAGSFELACHEVTRIQEGDTKAVAVPLIVEGHDLFFHVQTYGLAVTAGTVEERSAMVERVRAMGIPSVAAHLDKWFDLGREDQLAADPYFRVDHVFTADGGNEDRFAGLGINHHWMAPGVYAPECNLGRVRPEYESDIAFVGNWRGGYHTESVHRPALVEWLRRSYGERVRFWPRGPQVRGADLSDLYASARVVVGDSCLVGTDLDHGRYWSDRLPETVGRGGLLLHPHVEGLSEHFTPGEHLDCWDPWDWDRLRVLIDGYLDDPAARDRVRLAGRDHVLAHHTYTHRVEEIIETVGGPAQATIHKEPTVAMIPTLINDRWTLLLPEHRANRAEWVTGWERERWDSIHANVREGDTVLDIGTEEGDLSALLATWVGPTGKVALFEPTPKVWGNVRAIFEGNGLTDRVAAWFVGFAGPVERKAPDPERARDAVGRWPRCAYGPVIGDHGFAVIHQRPDFPVTTIDRFCEEHGLVPDLLTLDVEGAELEVLHGAGRVLETHHPLVYCSVHRDFMRDEFGRHWRELWTFLGDMGYEATELAEDHELHVCWHHPSRPFVAPEPEEWVVAT